jgi:hypothetical protein
MSHVGNIAWQDPSTASAPKPHLVPVVTSARTSENGQQNTPKMIGKEDDKPNDRPDSHSDKPKDRFDKFKVHSDNPNDRFGMSKDRPDQSDRSSSKSYSDLVYRMKTLTSKVREVQQSLSRMVASERGLQHTSRQNELSGLPYGAGKVSPSTQAAIQARIESDEDDLPAWQEAMIVATMSQRQGSSSSAANSTSTPASTPSASVPTSVGDTAHDAKSRPSRYRPSSMRQDAGATRPSVPQPSQQMQSLAIQSLPSIHPRYQLTMLTYTQQPQQLARAGQLLTTQSR